MNGIKIHFIADLDAESANFCPHLGVGYLSAYLKKTRGEVVTSLSLLSEDIVAEVERVQPDLIAVSSTSRHFMQLQEIVAGIKQRLPVLVVWGGVHLSIAPDDLPSCADVGVLGEGEETLAQLLDHFEDGKFRDLAAVPGITWRDCGGRRVTSAGRPLIPDLDLVPPPDLELLGAHWGRNRRGVMVTSRGCPYKCRFCASSLFWDSTRLHSAQYVVQEMLSIVRRFGVREILIYDDFFTIDRKRVAEIARLKRQYPGLARVRFECLSRIDGFDDLLAADLNTMGVYRVTFGIESGCQRTLDYLKNGKLTLEQVERAVQVAKAHGIECIGSFIIGAPYETEDEIEETYSFIERLEFDAVQIGVATPFPGTALWDDACKEGRISGKGWSDDYYALFALDPKLDVRAALEGKILVTGIDRERFLRLVEKGAKLQCSINFGFSWWFKYYVGTALKACGMGFITNFYNRLRRL